MSEITAGVEQREKSACSKTDKKQIQYIQSYITSVRIMMTCDELHRPLLWATFLLSSSRFSRRSVCWSYSAMRDCQGWSSMLELSSPSRTPLDLSKDGGYNLIQPYTTHFMDLQCIYDHLWPHSWGKWWYKFNSMGRPAERRSPWDQRPGTQWYAAGSSGSPLCNAPARWSRCPNREWPKTNKKGVWHDTRISKQCGKSM